MQYQVEIPELAELDYYPSFFSVVFTENIKWTCACPEILGIEGCHRIPFDGIFTALERSSSTSISGVALCQCKNCKGSIRYTVRKIEQPNSEECAAENPHHS